MAPDNDMDSVFLPTQLARSGAFSLDATNQPGHELNDRKTVTLVAELAFLWALHRAFECWDRPLPLSLYLSGNQRPSCPVEWCGHS